MKTTTILTTIASVLMLSLATAKADLTLTVTATSDPTVNFTFDIGSIASYAGLSGALYGTTPSQTFTLDDIGAPYVQTATPEQALSDDIAGFAGVLGDYPQQVGATYSVSGSDAQGDTGFTTVPVALQDSADLYLSGVVDGVPTTFDAGTISFNLSDQGAFFEFTTPAAPEPSTYALFGLGALALFGLMRYRALQA